MAKHPTLTKIRLNGKDRVLNKSRWSIKNLKSRLSVPEQLVLAKISPLGVQDLTERTMITLKDKDSFMTHVRSGGSS